MKGKSWVLVILSHHVLLHNVHGLQVFLQSLNVHVVHRIKPYGPGVLLCFPPRNHCLLGLGTVEWQCAACFQQFFSSTCGSFGTHQGRSMRKVEAVHEGS
eukprot:jgi/Botrbrau1/14704/Bobra.0108s0057.1